MGASEVGGRSNQQSPVRHKGKEWDFDLLPSAKQVVRCDI